MKTILIKCGGEALISLSDLTEFQGGLKKPAKKAIEKLKRRIIEDGFIAPFFIWRRGEECLLLDGHRRREALLLLQEQGYEIPELPCVYIDAEDEATAKRLLLSISSQYGEWNEEELVSWLKELDGDIAETMRLVDKEIKLSLQELVEEDDFEIPEEIETDIQFGDLFQIGEHRLLCGDSTDAASVAILMNGNLADMVFTDPPYGVAIGEKNRMLNSFQKAGRNLTDIESDSKTPDELYQVLLPAFKNIRNVMSDECTVFVTSPQGGGLGMMMMMMMMREAGLEIRHVLIWKKNSPTFSMGRLDYDYQHEPILLTWGKRHVFYGLGKHKTSVWEIDKPRACKEHPTMKPIALVENALLNNSKTGDIVIDFFLGSGTTMVAAHQLNRKCYGIELDPKYCQVIIDRMKKLDPGIEIKKLDTNI